MLIGETPISELPGIGDSFSVLSKAYSMDQWLIFTGSEPLEDPPGAIRYYLNRNNNALLKKTLTKTYEGLFANSQANILKTFSVDALLLKTLVSSSFDIILRPSYDSTIPSTSVIDALVWSYAEILDAVWRQMDTMSTALKLEHAQGTDLDNAWGQIFDLPRLVSEDDTAYRDRLKTRTIILNSSGTKANCEAILDSIVGEQSSNVDTQYPSCVRITFDSISAMRTAREKLSTLNILIPQMLAAGVSYDMILPYIDYDLDIVMNGPIWLPMNISYALKHKNTDAAYDFDLSSVFQNIITYNIDILQELFYNTSYLMGSLLRDSMVKTITNNIGLFGTFPKTLITDIVMSKLHIISLILMDSYLQKNNLEKSLLINLIDKATKRRMLQMETILTLQKYAYCDFDVVTRLYAKSLDVDILSQRAYPKKHTMRMTLVGA